MTGRWRDVRTQAELDAVLADGDWADIRGDAHFSVGDSATVRAYGSATVLAYGSATVTAAYDSATVLAHSSATVRAHDSATVLAYGSATVRAYDSATVTAYGSATVLAYGSATVLAADSATVEATPYVAVHRKSNHAVIHGGTVIETPDLTVTENWLAYYGIETTDVVVLYKLVGDDWMSGYGTCYSPDARPSAPDWEPTNKCGGGLHFSPHPHLARPYSDGSRFVACLVRADEIVPIGSRYFSDKCKAPRVVAPGCWPVDEDGNRIEVGG